MSFNQLQQARAIALPSREAMLRRDPSVHQFWHTHKALFSDAWNEWQQSEQDILLTLDSSLLDKRLRDAVTQAWQDPSKEVAVKELLQEVAPGVFELQFFDPERLADLREYLERVWDAQIPLRPPYGIVLNRRGAMLDSRSEGYLAAPNFQAFYREMLNTYMRPIARMLFPEIMGYDTQTFGFSIHYQPNTDSSIRPHTDASAVTLNINLNLPDEAFTGSAVDFFDLASGQKHSLTFKSGTAMIHRGNVVHAAQPITSGERTNFVLWLYGDRGQIPPQGAKRPAIDASERWTTPTAALDSFAPF
ncbi:2OG-Fe(II) oxygenase [Shewanella inventionis]|uniref:2OG-Fe(II) oxygenase family protein n=1 Tax=Shewanella inventionis TaxID=1738770 RepID=UPI001CC114D7|nr:2OG-Fe(II) oxygenase family protein [Shewanella inventionis]UAL44484.1 2OG-Fe(II) oxygenase [Shewanella inventionis]